MEKGELFCQVSLNEVNTTTCCLGIDLLFDPEDCDGRDSLMRQNKGLMASRLLQFFLGISSYPMNGHPSKKS